MKRCLCIAAIILIPSFKAHATTDTSFRIVGYYSLNYAMTKNVQYFPFEKLTHINLYFINPDSLGNFRYHLIKLVPFIKAAHAKNVRVLLSVGGGGKHPYYEKLLNDTNRTKFISNLTSLIFRYNLDGIDVDLEDKDITENYGKFITELASVLHEHNRIITAAVAIYFKDSYPDIALQQFDFVNLMSYDHTAAWAPDKPGPHASYIHAITDLAYFRIVRGIPKEKITLGVPFYGYGFGPTLVKRGITMNYENIVQKFPGAELEDEEITDDGKTIYYNGIPTIIQKTELAREEASGMMIWQLSGDASAPKSLLDAINQTVKN